MINSIKSIFAVIVGATGAQLLTFLSYPIITRLYTPEVVGILGLSIAVASFFSPIVSLGYQWAIALPKSLSHSREVFWLTLIISGIFTLLSYIILSVFYQHLVDVFGGVALYIVLFSPMIAFCQCFLSASKQYMGKLKQFNRVAYITFFLAFLINLFKVVFGISYGSSAILLCFSVLGAYLITISINLFWLYSSRGASTNKKLIKRYYVHLKKNKELSKYRSPHEFFNSASQVVPVLILGVYFDPAIIGFYTLARTISSAPVNLIGGSLGVIISPKLAYIKNHGEPLMPFLVKTSLIFFLSGIPIFGILFFYGQELFSFLFGSQWMQAGQLAEWLSLWFFSMYLTSSVNRLSPMIKAYTTDLIFAVLKLVIRIAAIYSCTSMGLGIVETVAALSLSSMALNFVYMWRFLMKAHKSDLEAS